MVRTWAPACGGGKSKRCPPPGKSEFYFATWGAFLLLFLPYGGGGAFLHVGPFLSIWGLPYVIFLRAPVITV